MAELGRLVVHAQSDSVATVNLRHVTIAQSVWPGDFNGDGLTDLAGSEAPPHFGGTGRVMVLVGNGDGTFTATNVTSYVGRVLGVGDFNGDNRIDLIVTDARDETVAILPGNGTATFAPPRVVASTSWVTFALSSDLDADGNRDLVVGAEGTTVAVFPGRGDFTFGPEATLATQASPHDGIITDLNGDGRKDLVVANHYFHGVTVLLNQGALQFSGTDVTLGGNANDVTVSDVNRDGKPDLIVATSRGGDGDFYFEEGDAEVLLGRGDGTFTPGVTYEVPRGAWQVVVGDFTRDGIVDIATANRSSIIYDDCSQWRKTWDSLSILPGRTDGTFGAASSFSLGNQSDPDDNVFKNQVLTLNTSDLNRDGATDLIASWGAVLLNVEADPNWAPTVDAGPDQQLVNTYETVLQARALDGDQDMLTWTWRDDTGTIIGYWPNMCYTLSKDDTTFTVTVDDGHGHQTSDTVRVRVSDTSSGNSQNPIVITAPAQGEVVPGGQPYTIRWTAPEAISNEELHVSVATADGAWTYIVECMYVPVARGQCVWNNPGPDSSNAVVALATHDAAVPGWGRSDPFTIASTPGAPPWPWQSQDVGAVSAAGRASYSDGVFTITGSGADVWGTADEFRYVYKFFEGCGSGDIDFITRVDSVQNVHRWTKAGLMVRRGLAAGAPHASIFVSPGKGIAFQRRTAANGLAVSTSGPLLAAPVWLRLSVRGAVVIAYYRVNAGDAWIKVGDQKFASNACGGGFSHAGLAVSSHVDGTRATAGFSNVTIAPWTPAFTPTVIGSTAGSGTFDGETYTVTNRGIDIWGTADQFTFVKSDWYGDGAIVVPVVSLTNSHAWAKAGAMFRDSLAPNSAHVMIVASPGKGLAMQYRATTGGTSAQAGLVPGAAPTCLRLTRAGNTFTGAWSADCSTWTTLGTVTVPLVPEALVGMAVTSHNSSASTTATFRSTTMLR